MANEIIFQCKSINNKNVRENELARLEKHEEELYFIIGEDRFNEKKRYYSDLETLNADFKKLEKIKEEMSKKPLEEEPVEEPVKEPVVIKKRKVLDKELLKKFNDIEE